MSQHSDTVCPSCRLPVERQARKCHHCGSMIGKPSRIEHASKKIMGYIGLFTAILSVFYALREGYFYIERQQQERQAVEAYIKTADRFMALNTLEYAEVALAKALEVRPSDWRLQYRSFSLQAYRLLRKQDDLGGLMTESSSELIPLGFSLLDRPLAPEEKGLLLARLGWLLQMDKLWTDRNRVTKLFEEAVQLAPEGSDVLFHAGRWMQFQEGHDKAALNLLQQAAKLKPNDARYWAALGKYHANREAYKESIGAYRQAIESRPDEGRLWELRVSNKSKRELVSVLLKADKKHNIVKDGFLDMTMQARADLIDFALEHNSKNRNLSRLASKLFFTTGAFKKAEHEVRKVLGKYSQRTNLEDLELFAAILEARNNDPDTLAEVRQLISTKTSMASYDEILETGYEGKHRYKIGLRIAKGTTGEGAQVLRTYEGYPFAKAGVQAKDQILEVAHRPITVLRDIWLLLIELSPGTDVPLKIKRDSEVLDLTLIVE